VWGFVWDMAETEFGLFERSGSLVQGMSKATNKICSVQCILFFFFAVIH
jgi:hypothetical protein